MCNGVDVAAGPTYVAFDKFFNGYAFVAVDVHPCPRAIGHTQIANNDNKKTAPKDRLEVRIVFLPFSKSILATVPPPFSTAGLSMESGRFSTLRSGQSPISYAWRSSLFTRSA
jgi:hypothetical protein